MLAFFCSQAAAAQDASAPPPVAPIPPFATAAPAPANDLVRLVNGDVYRGTIAESVRDSHVIIVTAAGDKRRFEWAEVAFAGAAGQAPPSRPRNPVEPPHRLELHNRRPRCRMRRLRAKNCESRCNPFQRE